MATPYIFQKGALMQVGAALALGGSAILQFTDDAGATVATLPTGTYTLAKDSGVVHTTGNESIGGIKTFTRGLVVANGTLTASEPVLDGDQTWNNAAITFTGLKLNVTDTTSAAGSLLFDFQVGGSSKISITKGGSLVMDGFLTINRAGSNPTLILNAPASGNTAYYRMYTGGVIRWLFGKEGTPETGSDAGSLFILQAYTDAGVAIDNPLQVARAAGGALQISRPTIINNTLTVNSADFYLTNSAASNTRFRVSSLAGAERGLLILTNSIARWEFIGSSDAESGSDAGTKFMIRARNDAGTVIDSPIDIIRVSGGLITIGGTTNRPVTITGIVSATAAGTHTFGNNAAAGTVLNIAAASEQVSRLQMTSAGGGRRWQIERNSTAESGSDAGSNFNLNAFSDADVIIDTPITIARASAGAMTFGGSTARTGIFTGNLTVQGTTFNTGVNAGTSAAVFINAAAATFRKVQFNTAGSARWSLATNSAAEAGANAGSDFQIDAFNDAGASLGSAFKITRSTMKSTFAGDLSIATGKVYQVNSVQVVTARKTGWATSTGTATRTAFDTTTVTTQQLAERVKALIDDLHNTAGHGLIGT